MSTNTMVLADTQAKVYHLFPSCEDAQRDCEYVTRMTSKRRALRLCPKCLATARQAE